MKKIDIKYFSKISLTLFFGLILLSSCSKDDPLTPNEEAFQLLKGTWGLGSIELDGVDLSANYPGFTLTFDELGYTAVAGGNLLNSGTWEWVSDSPTDIPLIEGKEIRLVTLTANSLIFTFTLNRPGGIANGINGDYRISLVK